MKKLVLVLLLICPAALLGATTTEVFPLTVHVVSSKWIDNPTTFQTLMTSIQIEVVISGQRYELFASPKRYEGLIVPGDYKASLVKNKHQDPSYEQNQSYMLQFPDGKTQNFSLEAVGE